MAIYPILPPGPLWSGIVGIFARVRTFMVPLWEFLFATSIGLIISGLTVGVLIPWGAGRALMKLFVLVVGLLVGSYLVLIISSLFRRQSYR